VTGRNALGAGSDRVSVQPGDDHPAHLPTLTHLRFIVISVLRMRVPTLAIDRVSLVVGELNRHIHDQPADLLP
jgi:hypothetical protein